MDGPLLETDLVEIKLVGDFQFTNLEETSSNLAKNTWMKTILVETMLAKTTLAEITLLGDYLFVVSTL